MKDEELIRAYAIGIFILTFLDEYGKLERTRSFAKVYNVIAKKNRVFQTQINLMKLGKKTKISYKSKLFLDAINCSSSAWENGIKDIEKLPISVGTTVSNLYRLNESILNHVYGFKKEDFISIHKHSQAGVTLSSCKMARILTDILVSNIRGMD